MLRHGVANCVCVCVCLFVCVCVRGRFVSGHSRKNKYEHKGTWNTAVQRLAWGSRSLKEMLLSSIERLERPAAGKLVSKLRLFKGQGGYRFSRESSELSLTFYSWVPNRIKPGQQLYSVVCPMWVQVPWKEVFGGHGWGHQVPSQETFG